MIKLIATDLDGTLLSGHGLSEFSAKAIIEAQQNGIEFVVATGRARESVTEIFDPYHIKFSAILGNGAQYVNEQGEILKEAYLDKSLFKSIVEVLEDADINYMIFTKDGYYSTRDPIQVRDAFIKRSIVRFKRPDSDVEDMKKRPMPCNQLVKIDDIDAWLAREDLCIIKVEAFNWDPTPVLYAKENLKNIQGISYLSSYPDNVEITDKYAQKGLILKSVIKDLGIDESEVAVFGDGLNDTTLFETFENSYAVENAVDEIKQLAKFHIGQCQDDSVAIAIKEILKNNQ